MRTAAGDRLRTLSRLGLAPLLERVLGGPWPARVQRIGTQALKRVSARFPALAELIEEGTKRVDGWLGERGIRVAGPPAYAPPPVNPAAPAAVREDATAANHLRTGLREKSWQARGKTISEWGGIPCAASVPLLVGALRDPSAEVAAAAAVALGNQGTSTAKTALLGVVRNAEAYFNPVTRAAAVQGLARCAAEGEYTALREAMTDVDAEVSLSAIAALSESAPSVAVPRLLEILGDRSGYFLPQVRVAAASALVRSGRVDDREVARLLSTEADPAVQSILSAGAAAN